MLSNQGSCNSSRLNHESLYLHFLLLIIGFLEVEIGSGLSLDVIRDFI
jgi:hypothetical protein